MKKTSILLFVLLGNINFLLAQSNYRKILELIKSVPSINVPEPSQNVIIPKKSIGFEGQGSNRTETFEEKDNITQTLEEMVAFNPNAQALYPGSLIQGKSLPDGVLNTINVQRTPITITVTDLIKNGHNPTYSKRINNPSLASVTAGLQQIVSTNLNIEQPARISYTETQMNSVEEAMLKLGASAKWLSGNVTGAFQSSSSSVKSRFMVRFIQSYYTISCEPPSNPASYISRREQFDDFKNYVGIGNPITYISSVTYGREFWMLIESDHEAQETKETLDAAFSSGFASGSVSLSNNQKQILNSSSIQILAIGGPGSGAIKVISGNKIDDLKSYLVSGQNYSLNSPGVVISYIVRYLADNNVARVSSSADYTIKTSLNSPEKAITNLQFTFNTGNDDKDDDNHVGIKITLLPKNIVLFENGDLRPRQFEDGDPTWHDDRPQTVQINSISQQIYQSDPTAKQIKVEVWKSGGAHWHFGYDFYAIFEGGTKMEIGHSNPNDHNFGGGYNRDSWTYNINW